MAFGYRDNDEVDDYLYDDASDPDPALSDQSNFDLSSPIHPLTPEEVKGAVSREILDSHGAILSGTEISNERQRALRFFFGKPLGNEIEGRSEIVLTEVADTIHWMMPSLMRMFASGEDIWEFQATNPKHEAGAKQATKFINQMFWEDQGGFEILYDFFFTAMLEKTSFVTVYWDERVEPKIMSYEGLTPGQVEMLLEDGPDLEVVEFNERAGTTGEPVMDLTVRQTGVTGKIKVRGVPPEEFLMARRTPRLDDDIVFAGERRKVTASDLIAMGFDPEDVMSWPSDESPEFTQERTSRLQEEENFPLSTADRPDAASREMWINNVYMRLDEDGDGYAELRHIIVIGDTSMELLLDEYANFAPFASMSMSPVPHKFYGLSIVDLVGDLQVIRTTLMRQMLDNLYLQNNQQVKVVTGNVELSDLLTSRPGNVIRMDSLDSMEPVVTPPLPAMAMEMMNYLDQIRELRTGVSRFTQGLDGGSLNGTATGVNAMMGASQARIELIGRIFAATGMKRLGKLLLRTYIQHDNKMKTIKLNGEWTDIDPSMWNEDMGIKIKTGLGIGAANEQIQFLMATIELQKQAIQSGANFMVKPKDLYRAVTELNKAMGFRGADVFFSDPGDAPWPEPAPDVKVLEHQRRAKDDEAARQIERLRVLADDESNERLSDFRIQELDQNNKLELARHETMVKVATIQRQEPEESEENE